jgi:hypothetical protein
MCETIVPVGTGATWLTALGNVRASRMAPKNRITPKCRVPVDRETVKRPILRRLKFDTDQFRKMFGMYGEERHPEEWVVWLQLQGADARNAIEAINDLVAAGCDRATLIGQLMDLHRSLYLKDLTRSQLAKAIGAVCAAKHAVNRLAGSTMAYGLGLMTSSGGSLGAHLDLQLWSVEQKGREALKLDVATRREKPAFVGLFRRLATFVHDSTGTFRDKDLNEIVSFLKEEEFDSERWRNHHGVRAAALGTPGDPFLRPRREAPVRKSARAARRRPK